MWILLTYALLTKLVNIILYMVYCSIFNTKYYLLKTVNLDFVKNPRMFEEQAEEFCILLYFCFYL